MDFLCNVSPDELVALSSIISIALAKDLTTDEVNALGNFLSSIGQNLSTIATQREFNEVCKGKSTDTQTPL